MLLKYRNIYIYNGFDRDVQMLSMRISKYRNLHAQHLNYCNFITVRNLTVCLYVKYILNGIVITFAMVLIYRKRSSYLRIRS